MLTTFIFDLTLSTINSKDNCLMYFYEFMVPLWLEQYVSVLFFDLPTTSNV